MTIDKLDIWLFRCHCYSFMFFYVYLLACRCNYLEFFPHRFQQSEIYFVFIQQSFASYWFVLCIRRYAALYVSEHFIPSNGETDELLGFICN